MPRRKPVGASAATEPRQSTGSQRLKGAVWVSAGVAPRSNLRRDHLKKVAARRGLKRRHCRRRNSLHDLLGAKAKIRLAATAHLRSGRTRRAHVAQAFHGSSRKSA